MKTKERILALMLLLLPILLAQKSIAQTPTYFKVGTGTTGNTIPMGQASQKTQLLYPPGDFNTLPISGNINKIYFRNSASAITSVYTDFKVLFIQNTDLAFPATSFYTGLTQALNEPSFTITGNATAPGWFEIALTTPFLYDNTKTLIVEIQYSARTGATFSTTTTTSTGFNRRCSGTSLVATTGTTNTTWNDFGMDIIPSGGCTTPPTAGASNAVPSAGLCLGNNISLSLTGNSTGSGQTYQWQSSPTIGFASPSNVGASQVSPALNTSATATLYYRCQVTCSGNSQYSTPVLVSVNPPFAAGTYTINSNLATGGSNFQTFTAAVSALNCGIGGPIIFNVDPSSGPYTEQVTIPVINGVSSTNTVTFNGNGRTLQFTPLTANRHVLKFNGADYVTVNNLIIKGLATDFDWGIHLTNASDNVTVSNCIIDISANTSTTQSNSAGIVSSNSTTVVTTTGNNANNLTITGCTIKGAYQGIILNGIATSLNALNNSIINNAIIDSYGNGIELVHNDGALVQNNNISRPARTIMLSGSAGIEIGTGCKNVVINANRIHDTHTLVITQSGTSYGIYFNACDAPSGNENKVTNNIIYNFNSLTGTQYGLYNSSSDGVYYYHNTIVLDNQTSTSGVTRGIYQTTAASNINVKNNIISVTRAGTGTKHCLYYSTAASVIVSNNNVLYVNAPGTTVGVGTYVSTNSPDLISWKAANGSAYDQLSIDNDPIFISPITGNFTPQSSAVNGSGTGVGILTDILGNTRSLTTPDPGAYEYSLLGTDAEISWVSPVFPFTTGLQNIVVNITNQQAQTISSINLTYSDGTTNQTANFTGLSIAPAATQQLTFPVQYNLTSIVNMRAYINNVNGSADAFQGNDTTSQFICLPMSGIYTINSGATTGGGNFNNFSDAVTALSCSGITGAVTFNVNASSGPYNEQIIIPSISGASSINTITFNGNGRTLNYTSVNSNERATLKLNGADHFIFNNLVITASGFGTTEYGYGVQIVNDADSNVVNNCTITSTSTPTTAASLNFAGLIVNSSPVVITTGNSQCDHNIISGNTITGGYYGIAMVANGATNTIIGNQIINNTIRDFYEYGVYLNGNDGSLIEGNSISRPNRASVTTFRGIGLSGVSINTVVNKNKLFNPFGAAASSTAAGFCIYLTNCNATAGNENIISNNLIYGHIGSSGNHNGILHSTSNYTKYYHNTIVLNDVAATCTACAARGFYQSGTTVTGLEFENNIITVSQGGTSTKQCIFFEATSVSGVTLNGNNYLMTSTGGAQNEVGRIGGNATNTATGTGYQTIFDWQTGTSQEINSVSVNPFFVNAGAGNYKPQVIQGDNIGVPLGILTDITGAARSVATPDAGAYEFTGTINDFCTGTPSAGNASGSNNLCNNQSATLTISGYTNLVGITLQWKQSNTQGGPYINVTGGSGATTAIYTTALLTATTYYVCEVSCAGGSSALTNEVQITVTTPSILATSPDTRCGLGSVNLSASGTASFINWYNQPSGGSILSVGSNYAPSINTTSTFYAAAAEPIVPAPVMTGFSGNLLGTVSGHTVGGNMFNVTAINEIKINSFDIHLQVDNTKGPSDITVYYKIGTYSGFTTTPAAWTLLGSTTGIVSAGVGVPTPLPIPINLTIPAGQTYGFYIVVTNLDVANPIRYNTSATSPAELAVAASDFNMQIIAGTAIFGPFTTGVATPAKRLWNGRVNYTYNCEGPRTAVVATVTPAPPISIASTFPAVCVGGSTDLSVSSINDPNYTYTWTSSPIGFTATGQGPHTVSPSVSTTYYVFAHDNSGNSNQGCDFLDSITVVAGGTLASGTISATQTQHCVSGSSVLTLAGASGGLIQWQKSTVGISGPWSNIGSGTTTLNTGTLTQTTYYQVVVACQLNSVTTNILTITVTTPAIVSTTPATRCGPGSVTLQATGTIGTTLNWYSLASGGAAIGTGVAFVTPSIINTTDFYVSATSDGTNETVGLSSNSAINGTYSQSAANDWPIRFTVNTAGIITQAYFYPTTAATYTVALRANLSSTNLQTTTITTSSGQIGTKVLVPLNFAVTPGTYQLTSPIGGGVGRFGTYTGGGYPFTSPSGAISIIGSATSSTSTTSNTTTYNSFYDIMFSSGCESARVPITATVNPSPTVDVNVAHAVICTGQSATLTATSTNPGYSYTWNPGSLTGASVSVTPTSNTTYTLSAIDISGGMYDQCTALGTATVNTATGLPPDASISNAGSVCEGFPITLGATNNAPGQSSGNTYSWSTDAVTPYSSTSSTASVTSNATVNNSGNYTVVITNSFLCTASATDVVTVNPNPVLNASSITDVINESCPGASDGSFQATATSGTAPFDYSIDGGNSSNQSGSFTGLTPGTYSVQVVSDFNGCVSASTPVTITSPNLPPTVSCPGNQAANAAAGLCSAVVSYSTPGTGIPAPDVTYAFTGATTGSGTGNGSGEAFNVGTTTVTVTVSNSCGTDACSFDVVVTDTQNPVITCPANIAICNPTSQVVNFTVNATDNCSIASVVSTPASGSIFPVGTTTVNSVATDVNGNTSTCSFTVTISTPSTAPTSATTDAANNNICLGNSVILTQVGGSIGTGASYKWYSGSCGGTLVGTGASITLSPAATTTYYVRAEGACNTTTCASVTVVVSTSPVTSLALMPFTGMPSNVCAGTVATLSIAPVSRATYYVWDAPTGSYFNGVVTNVSPFTTTTPSVQVTFGSPSGSLYNIGVQAGNACGTSVRQSQKVRGLTSVPASVSGPTTACANSVVTYSTAAVTGATSYLWTVTGNATVSGTGTTATVTFGSTYTGGTVCVAAQTTCYTSPTKCITISTSASTLNAISGTFTACPNSTLTYSVPASTGAASYTWTLPPGATGSSTTNSINVTYGAGYSAVGSICVSVTSTCGVTSAVKCKTVAPGLPSQPASISGALTGLCNQTVVYSTPSQGSGITYTWTSPGTINTGQGSTSISTTFAALSTGNVCVTASNSCGSSTSRCVPVKGAPNAPGAITATPPSWCANTSGIEFDVNTASLTGTYTLSWTYPPAAVVTYAFGGGNSNSLILDWKTGSGNVNVTASNGCGTATKTSTWSSTCREGSLATVSSISVSPNPTTGMLNINYTATKGITVINVLDLAGRVVMTQTTSSIDGANATQIDLGKVAKGAYMLSVQSTQGNKQVRVVVE